MGNITNINHDQDLFTNTINVGHFYILTHISFRIIEKRFLCYLKIVMIRNSFMSIG